MKNNLQLMLLFVALPFLCGAQTTFAHIINAAKATGAEFTPRDLFHAKENLTEFTNRTYLQLQQDIRGNIVEQRPDALTLTLPFKNTELVLELIKNQAITPDFEVLDALTNQVYPVEQGVFYRGYVSGDSRSVAAISVFNDQVIGVLSTTAYGNMALGRMPNQPDNNLYVMYATDDLPSYPGFVCGVSGKTPDEIPATSAPAESNVTGCVRVSLEIGYDLFVYNGNNVQSTVNYINGVMNVVTALYQAESVSIAVSQMFIWTTPFAYDDDAVVRLSQFSNFRTNYNGDIAHLITALPGGGALGGQAYINVLCVNGGFHHAVSDILETYEQLPSFSYTVNVIAHEMGHNIGSPHTHNCSWPGGAIDDCATPEGSCPPGPSGQPHTVMSYCPFPVLNGGFGTLPGNLIRNKVQNAACLAASCTTPACPAPSNFALVGLPLSTSATFIWTGGAGNTSYNIQYREAGTVQGWTTVNGVSSPATISGLIVDTEYEALVQGVCSGTPSPYFTGIIFKTRCNEPSVLTQTNITQNTALLGWTENNGASSWEIKYGSPGFDPLTGGTAVSAVSNPYLLTGLTLNTSYQWYVRSACPAAPTGYSDYAGPGSFMTLAGDICTWQGGAASWSANAANWSCGHIPTANDNVIINNGNVSLVQNTTVNALTINGGTLSGNFNLNVTNNFVHNGGFLTGTGTCTVGGLYNGNVSNSNVVSLYILDKSMLFNGGGTINNANLYIRGGSIFTIPSDQTLTYNSSNSSVGVFKYTASSLPTTLALQPGGIIKKTGTQEVKLDAFKFNNQGEIRNESNALLMAYLSGTGNTHVNGSIYVASGAEIIVTGGTHDLNNCSIYGGGLFTSGVNNPILNMSNTTSVSNDMRLNAWYNATWNWSGFNATFLSFRIAGNVTGTGNITTTEFLTMDGAPNYNVSGDVTCNGDMPIYYGTCTMAGSGTLTVNGKIDLILQSGVTVPTILVLNKDAALYGNITSNSALNALNIGAGKTFDCASTTNQTASTAGSINVNGTLKKSGSAALFTISMPVNVGSTGQIIPTSGTLKINGSSTTLSGTVKGTSTLDLAGAYSNTGTFAPGLSPGTLNFIGNYTNSTLNFEIQESGGVVSKDLLNITGNMTLGGTLNVQYLSGNIPPGTYDIATCTGTRTGTFATINYPANCNGNCSVVYTSNKAQLVLAGVLPLELLAFDLLPVKDDIQVRWQTAHEENTRNFDIERSTDGHNWNTIGSQDARNVPDGQNTYAFTDTNISDWANSDQTIYYRLKMNNLDGGITFSPIKNTRWDTRQNIQISPNPAKTLVHLTCTSTSELEQSIRIVNMSGQVCRTEQRAFQKGMNTFYLDIADLVPGGYFVQIGAEQVILVKE